MRVFSPRETRIPSSRRRNTLHGVTPGFPASLEGSIARWSKNHASARLHALRVEDIQGTGILPAVSADVYEIAGRRDRSRRAPERRDASQTNRTNRLRARRNPPGLVVPHFSPWSHPSVHRLDSNGGEGSSPPLFQGRWFSSLPKYVSVFWHIFSFLTNRSIILHLQTINE